MSILEVKSISKSFGGVQANVDISVAVEQGSIVGLIGPNGSGKTTLFNSIVGTHPIDKGSIVFDNTEVSEMPVPAVAKLGLLRTFQQTRIYSKLNCVENMLISHKASDSGFIFAKVPAELTEKAETLLNFVGLYQKRNLRAGDLSFGQQKLLELAMALMNEPKMLLLDEPTAGINPTLINGIIDRLIKVNTDYGITLLVIEHNMKVILVQAIRPPPLVPTTPRLRVRCSIRLGFLLRRLRRLLLATLGLLGLSLHHVAILERALGVPCLTVLVLDADHTLIALLV